MQGLEDARVNLTGDIEQVSKDEDPQIRDLYKKKHPNSFWIDFGDFSLFRLTPRQGRLIGGFARAGKVYSISFVPHGHTWASCKLTPLRDKSSTSLIILKAI